MNQGTTWRQFNAGLQGEDHARHQRRVICWDQAGPFREVHAQPVAIAARLRSSGAARDNLIHNVKQVCRGRARPGATAADLFHVMDKIVTGGAGGSEAGRYGHGLGMNLTEWPSLIPTDHTPLVPGMVLTLEPGIELAPGRALVHEENIVIRETGAEWLSQPYGAEMLRI